MGFGVNTAGVSSQGHFSRVPADVAAPRSRFDRSFSHKTTINETYIYPVMWEPLLPGDTVNLTMASLCRLSTPLFPYMDSLYLDFHGFFVPNRLLWDNWESFQGQQTDPDDSTDFEVPALSAVTHSGGFGELSIYDYFGLPTKVASVVQADMPISLPFRAYYSIWNYFYRDENLQDSLVYSTGDAADTTAFALQKRNRRKDYFTSGLPWPQKGPAVQLPGASGFAPIERFGTAPTLTRIAADGSLSSTISGANFQVNSSSQVQGPTSPLIVDVSPNMHANVSSLDSFTVNEMREAIVLQQMLELDARGGTRYPELVLARFGVVLPDFRAQRPEYCGGQTVDINVNPIAQTSSSDADTPQGNLAAFAVGRGKARINYSACEHGQFLILCSIRSETQYQEGLRRDWSVRTRYDYYEPLQANLGEQATLNKEVKLQANTVTNNAAWCYQERWAEYRFKFSYVTGLMRSNATLSLDTWGLWLDFPSLPTLEDLLPDAPPIDRIVAVPSEPHFLLDTYTRFAHVRVMPVYSKPGLLRL
nr:MAG: major capsid protein [Microvirus sp.]